jgi:hypothetical protein
VVADLSQRQADLGIARLIEASMKNCWSCTGRARSSGLALKIVETAPKPTTAIAPTARPSAVLVLASLMNSALTNRRTALLLFCELEEHVLEALPLGHQLVEHDAAFKVCRP